MANQSQENNSKLNPGIEDAVVDTELNDDSESPSESSVRSLRKGFQQKASSGRGRSAGRSQDRGNRTQDVELIDKVVHINRTTKVVKGGRRFGFSALVVVGDQKGKVGIGFGKANEVANAVKKATESASKKLQQVVIKDGTIPHPIKAQFDGGYVLLRPASPGTGIIAGAGVRAVVEVAGIRDILAKSLGSANPFNVVHATLCALKQLRSAEEIYSIRGKKWRRSAIQEITVSVEKE
jgi:small subunit ribosomal protein S5